MASTLYQFKADLKGLEDLEKKLKQANRELEKLKKNTDQYKKKSAEIATMGKQFTGLKNSMGQATNAANKMNVAGNRLVNTFQSAAIAIASAFAVRAIVGAVRGVVTVFAEFESKMAAVKAISGASASEFEKMKSAAEKLGKTTVFTAAQVAELQEEFARLGFSSEEILKVQSATLNLAAATGESLANSAQTAGNVLRAFNLEAEQTQRVTDVMAVSFTNSALNLEKFKESMKFVAPVARATGFTIEETSAMMMKLADNGLSGSIAGNGLKNIMLKLGDANSKLSRKLGRTVQGMPDLIEAMKELGGSAFTATDAVDLLDKRSAPAFLALMNNINGLEDSVEILNDAEGATARMAAIRLDTLQGDMTLMKSAMEGLGIAIGDKFDLGLRNTLYTFTRWVQELSESKVFLDGLKFSVNLLLSVMTALAVRMAAMGVIKFKNMIVDGTKAIGHMITSLRGATVAQEGLNTTMRANPYVAAASAIAFLVTAIITLGDEASEAEMKITRMNDAMEDDVKTIGDLNESTSERAQLMRDFANDYGDYLANMDLEIASNIQIKELQEAMKDNADRDSQIKDNEEIIQQKLTEIKLYGDEEVAAGKATAKRIEASTKLRGFDKRLMLAANLKRVNYIRDRELEIEKLREQTNEMKKESAKRIQDTKAYNALVLNEEDNYRTQRKEFYEDELARYRRLTRGKQLEMQAEAESELLLTQQIIKYKDLEAATLGVAGDKLKDAEKKLNKFVGTLKGENKEAVVNATMDMKKLNIEVTLLDKYVSNLDAALKKGSKTIKKDSPISGELLNKTKDHYKDLQKLMGEIIETSFQDLNNAAVENFRINENKYNKEIALAETNQENLMTLQNSSDDKLLAATIKKNRNKFAVLKNLSSKEYNELINADEGSLKARLNMIDRMLEEEQGKIATNYAVLDDLRENFRLEQLKNENQKNMEMAQNEMSWNEAIINNEEMGHINSFARFKRLKEARHAFEKVQTETAESEMQRRLDASKLFNKREIEEINIREADGLITAEEATAQRLQADQDYADAKTQITRDGEAEIARIKSESTKKDLATMGEQIQMVGDMYNQMFSMASSFINNRFELQMQKLQETRDGENEDLQDAMEHELEMAEGNEELQDAIRKKYELKQLESERKKEQETRKIKKKQFMMEKMNSIVNAIINGAVAVTKTASSSGFPAMLATTPVVTGLMAAQIALIASQKFVGKKGGIIPGKEEKFADGGMVYGPSHANGGVKFAAGGRVVELEGGEAVINKRSTAMFHNQLSAMNQAGGGKKFAAGGLTPGTSNAVNDIANTNMATFMDKLGYEVINGVNNKKVIMTESDVTTTQTVVSVTESNAELFV